MEILPLGSIVFLKGGTKKVMIIARTLNLNHNGQKALFDYAAVPYPEGLTGDQLAYFNADKVSKIIFEGYHDVEDENMVETIQEYLEAHPDLPRIDPADWK